MTLIAFFVKQKSHGLVYFNLYLKVLQLCGFHGNPTFLSYILPEIIILNTSAKFEVKISVQMNGSI